MDGAETLLAALTKQPVIFLIRRLSFVAGGSMALTKQPVIFLVRRLSFVAGGSIAASCCGSEGCQRWF